MKFHCAETHSVRFKGPIQKPCIVTSFSYDKDRHLSFGNSATPHLHNSPHDDALHVNHIPQESQVSIYRPVAHLPVRLDDYIDSLEKRKGFSHEGIVSTVLALGNKIEHEANSAIVKEQSVITNRGILTKIAMSLIDSLQKGDDPVVWRLNVMVVDGTLYVELADESDSNEDPAARRMAYHGYAYENVATVPWDRRHDPHYAPSRTIDVTSQWCPLIESGYAGQRWIVGGEVDCISDPQHRATLDTIEPRDFIELKCTSANAWKRAESFKETRMPRFFFQAFFLGTPRLGIGVRDPKSSLLLSEAHQVTLSLEKHAHANSAFSVPASCNVLHEVITQCKSLLTDHVAADQDQEKAAHSWPVFQLSLMRRDPNEDLSFNLEQLSADFLDRTDRDRTFEYCGFLPKSFVDTVRKYPAKPRAPPVHMPPLDSVNLAVLFPERRDTTSQGAVPQNVQIPVARSRFADAIAKKTRTS